MAKTELNTKVKLVQRVKVKNDLGLHTRPAALLVKLLQNSPCDIFFTHKRETINAKSMLSILMLAARKNASITVTIEGGTQEEAESIMQKLQDAFDSGFGE